MHAAWTAPRYPVPMTEMFMRLPPCRRAGQRIRPGSRTGSARSPRIPRPGHGLAASPTACSPGRDRRPGSSRRQDAARLLEGPDQIEHRRAGPGAEVQRLHPRLVAEMLDGEPVRLRDVHDVDVVTDRRPVAGVVVAAEYLQFLQLARGDQDHVGDDVARHAARALADQPARVPAGRIEVAQGYDAEIGVGSAGRLEHLLADELRAGVRVDRGGRVVLGDRPAVLVAVDRAGGRENQLAHAVRPHRAQQADRAADVDVEVVERDRHGLPDGLLGREVNDGADVVGTEHAIQAARVAQVDVVDGGDLAGQATQSGYRRRIAVREVVYHDHVVVMVEQLRAGVTADEPGTPGDQYRHARLPSLGKMTARGGPLTNRASGSRTTDRARPP